VLAHDLTHAGSLYLEACIPILFVT
jgi:hypothetical protein